jgi:diadenosine tetraphosphate (Ap4A) HIT family hydrolase
VSENNLLNLSEARVSEQLEQMQKLRELGICPFCPEYLAAYHREPILFQNEYWVVTKNDWPYEGSEIHLLLIHKRHIQSLKEISLEASVSLHSAFDWIMREFHIPGGAFVMRFGEMNYNGATVSHLHAHIVSGSEKNERSEPIKVKIGYKNNPPT